MPTEEVTRRRRGPGLGRTMRAAFVALQEAIWPDQGRVVRILPRPNQKAARRVLVSLVIRHPTAPLLAVGFVVVASIVAQKEHEVHLANLYAAAQGALAEGRWQEARDSLTRLQLASSAYMDAATLVKESYYRPGRAHFKAGRYRDAIPEFVSLRLVDSSYRDSEEMLLESHYQMALESLEREEWEGARLFAGRLLAFTAAYRDTDSLIAKSYYLPAQKHLREGSLDQAIAGLLALHAAHTPFRDSRLLLTEAYYRRVRGALERGEWVSVRANVDSVLALSPGYKDVEGLRREAYFRPAALYAREGQAVRARLEIERLLELTPDDPAVIARWWVVVGGTAGDCLGVLSKVRDEEFPAPIRSRCSFAPSDLVRRYILAYLNGRRDELDGMMSTVGRRNVRWWCGGAAAGCLDRNYSGGGYSFEAATVVDYKERTEATVVLRMRRGTVSYCQRYDLSWQGEQAWGVTFFNPPAECHGT